MKKSTLLAIIEQTKNNAELKEIEQGTMMTILIALLEYIGDSDIETAVEGVPM